MYSTKLFPASCAIHALAKALSAIPHNEQNFLPSVFVDTVAASINVPWTLLYHTSAPVLPGAPSPEPVFRSSYAKNKIEIARDYETPSKLLDIASHISAEFAGRVVFSYAIEEESKAFVRSAWAPLITPGAPLAQSLALPWQSKVASLVVAIAGPLKTLSALDKDAKHHIWEALAEEVVKATIPDAI